MNGEMKIVDAEVVGREIGPAIDEALANASKVAASIVDDASREIAVDMGVAIRGKISDLESGRVKFYEPAYRLAESLREVFDPRIKQGKAILKTLSAGVSEYDIKKRREADQARERAEAEARKIREEAEKKRREAEEAERRRVQAIEDEKRRIREAEEAEERRIKTEAEAKARADRERREAEQAELDRKRAEEETARLAHAQVAEDVGNGGAKVDTILSSPTPIASPVASPQLNIDRESLAAQQLLADKTAQEKAERERVASEAAKKAQDEATAASKKAAEEAEAAEAAAAAATAAAAAVTAARPDDRTRKSTTWKWQVRNEQEFKKLLKAVVEDRAPVEYAGFDPNAPEKFRPSAIGKDLVKLKESFKCDGIETWPHEETNFKAAA